MKIISLGMGRKMFEKNFAQKQRQIEYGKFFDEYHLIIFSPNSSKFKIQN